MRLAIVHDGIFCKGGAERVLLNIHKAFPDAPIYTSIYDKNNSYSDFQDCDIRTSWLQNIVKKEQAFKNTFFFLGVNAMQSHDLSGYDVILTSTTHCAKYLKFNKKKLFINYCYTPFRLVWNPKSYKRYENSKGIYRYLFDKIIQYLKNIDYKYAQKADRYIAMTQETSNRIKQCYNVKNKIKIICPSIDTNQYYLSNSPKEYYLIVSRLEKYKMVDLAIKAFNKLGVPLKIIGGGMEEKYFKNLAKDNIEFLGKVNQERLLELYSNCKALIFPQHEDFGLTPLEANSSGRPVIAYGKGGIVDTMIPYNGKDNKFTSVFFKYQNMDSLIEAINTFERLEVDPIFIKDHAKRFDDDVFIKQLREFIRNEYSKHN